jgi:hypothetical protein
MSLTAAMTDAPATAKITLRTADQYTMWKARVTDACWAATHKDPFQIKDDDCKAALKDFDAAQEQKSKAKKGDAPTGPPDWVGKMWMIITGSLHDDIYRKVSHIQRGYIASLLLEIQQALVVNNAEDVPPLMLELYGGTMQKDAGNDLQSWISFLMERVDKLAFLHKVVERTN